MLITRKTCRPAGNLTTLPVRSTLHNEPHLPMDSVMRGFSQLEVGDTVRAMLVGAAGGASAGALSSGGWMIPASMGTTAVAQTTDAVLSQMGEARRSGGYDPSVVLRSPFVGAAVGLVSGTTGYLLSAATGLSPVLTGAITGAGTGLALELLTR